MGYVLSDEAFQVYYLEYCSRISIIMYCIDVLILTNNIILTFIVHRHHHHHPHHHMVVWPK